MMLVNIPRIVLVARIIQRRPIKDVNLFCIVIEVTDSYYENFFIAITLSFNKPYIKNTFTVHIEITYNVNLKTVPSLERERFWKYCLLDVKLSLYGRKYQDFNKGNFI